jgi:hypothetical protein
MARKYEPVPGSGFNCWSLEKCEEEIFIVALSEISGLIPPGQKWQRTLEYHFFELGKGLADETLIEMNGARQQHGLEPISITETAVGDYASSRDESAKSRRRRQIREELGKAGPEVRAKLLAQAKAEKNRLSPAHYTYEDFKLRKLQQDAARPPGQGDIAKIQSARRAGDAPDAILIGARLPPRSDKHANFQRLFPGRTANVSEAIRKLTNLSSPNYEFEEPEVEKIFNTLRQRLNEAHAKFRRRLTIRSRMTS